MSNLPYTARRVFTDAEKAIYHRIRQELAFWVADHRRSKAANTATACRVCALHKVLNTLRGRPDSHMVKVNKRGYDESHIQLLAKRILDDARLDVGLPLRCYVLVHANGLKPGMVPTKPQLHVQAAHALCELMKGYGQHPDITQWADVDRTLVVCQIADYWKLPRMDIGYCPYGSAWGRVAFTDGYYGVPLAHALYPMTERQAVALGITTHPLL